MTKVVLFTLATLCTFQIACGGSAKQSNTGTTPPATTSAPGGGAESQPSR